MKTLKELKEEIKRIKALDVEGFDSDWVFKKFARDQAIINIELIKPYTDKYELIVRFLVTGKDAHAATGAADTTPAAAAAFDSSCGAASIDSAADAAFDSAYEAASTSDSNAADAAYYAAAYADAASYYVAGAVDSTDNYTKAIESLTALADEYLALLPQKKAGDDITDAELSLAVARIMHPKYEWVEWGGVAASDNDGMEFSYKDKDCAFDMAVWLAKRAASPKFTDIDRVLALNALGEMLLLAHPQHALAVAIKETGEGE